MTPLYLPGSLDRLQELAAATRAKSGAAGCAVLVAAADHGVARHGISALRYGDTLTVLRLVASRRSPVNQLCQANGLELYPLNIGCLENPSDSSHIISKYHVQAGAGDISEAPAMSQRVVEQLLGLADSFVAGLTTSCLCLGEIGIGNTTAATCLACALLDLPCDAVVGRGSGIDPTALSRKRELAARALNRVRQEGTRDTLGVLASLGGLEIAWNVGVVLAARRRGLTVFLDGFISSVAGLVAEQIEPGARAALRATHLSSEPGHRPVLDALGQCPFLDLGLGLGQGFGAAAGFVFLRSIDLTLFQTRP